MEVLGRNGYAISPVTKHDVSGCNLGGSILYQNKHLWLLPCKQSRTSHSTLLCLRDFLPLSFCMRLWRKVFLTSGIFIQLIALALICSWAVLFQVVGKRPALVAYWQGLLHPWVVSVTEEAKTENWWLDPAQKIVEQFWRSPVVSFFNVLKSNKHFLSSHMKYTSGWSLLSCCSWWMFLSAKSNMRKWCFYISVMVLVSSYWGTVSCQRCS